MSVASSNYGELRASFQIGRGDDFHLDLDLTIPPGQTAALLGPNGAGKSTTVSALAGTLPIDAGRISLGDLVLDEPSTDTFIRSEDRRIGVVFQDYLLFDHLTVAENLAFGPTASGLSRPEARSVAMEWLVRLDLVDFSHRRPTELSGGQAQRVAVARALAMAPELLLLDEPLAALDVETRTHLRRVLRTYLDTYGGPRLLITHDPTDAFLLADTVHVLEDGRISQSGTPEEIRRAPATPYVAALTGLNLLAGSNAAGVITLDDFNHTLSSSDTHTVGPVLITIPPNAIALHATQPEGSPRNSWPTTIASLEPLGDITRVMLDAPLALSVDITPGAASAMSLVPGTEVWASIKATEVNVNPA